MGEHFGQNCWGHWGKLRVIYGEGFASTSKEAFRGNLASGIQSRTWLWSAHGQRTPILLSFRADLWDPQNPLADLQVK